MKLSLLLFSSMALAVPMDVAEAQATVTKSLIKSFNVEGKDVLTVDLGEYVTMQDWANNYVRVQVNITLSNASETTLKSLIESGRYYIKSVTEGTAMRISAPALRRPPIVNGIDIAEEISFIIFAPAGLGIESVSSSPTDQAASKTNTPDSQ